MRSGTLGLGIGVLATAGLACEPSEKPADPRAAPKPVIATVTSAAPAVKPVSSVVAAPSPAEPAAAKPATSEPCRLLTLEEASVFLRGPATASPHEKMPFASSCIWEAKDPRRGLQVMLSTAAQLRADEALRDAGADTPDRRFAQLVESRREKGDGTPIAGLGDAALWSEAASQLWVLENGRALVAVSFHGGPPASDTRERCVEVAKKIVPRIGL